MCTRVRMCARARARSKACICMYIYHICIYVGIYILFNLVFNVSGNTYLIVKVCTSFLVEEYCSSIVEYK